MNPRINRWILIATLSVLPLGCGPSDGSDETDSGVVASTDAGDAHDAGNNADKDAGSVRDAGTPPDAGATQDAGNTSGCSGYTPVSLTVLNYLAWCSVSVEGATPSPNAEQTVCVADGSVTLDATALSGFVLGDWWGTSGDTGTGDPGTVTGSGPSARSKATVTASGASVCVSVCCPGAGGSAPCPSSNQCTSATAGGYP